MTNKRSEAAIMAARALTDLNKWALIELIVESMYASVISTPSAETVLSITKRNRARLLRIYDKSRATATRQ